MTRALPSHLQGFDHPLGTWTSRVKTNHHIPRLPGHNRQQRLGHTGEHGGQPAHGAATTQTTRHNPPRAYHANTRQFMDHATAPPEAHGRSTQDQLETSKTLPTERVDPVALGAGTLVGTRGTVGTHPRTVQHMWNPTWGVRTNAASLLPNMVHVLDGLGDMVERLVPPRPRVATHSNTPRTMALRAPPHPTHPRRYVSATGTTQVPFSGGAVPVPGPTGHAQTTPPTSGPNTKPRAIHTVDHQIHRHTVHAR